MSKSIRPEQLADALSRELEIYGNAVRDGIRTQIKRSLDRLVMLTRMRAPKGVSRVRYADRIDGKVEDVNHRATRGIWYVKSPGHRMTHLLVHGHATRNGDHTRANPFLVDSLDEVLPEYEHEVAEVIRNA